MCKEVEMASFIVYFVLSGNKFDIKDYHHVFLSAGLMGLDTLEEVVDEYIDSTLAQWTQELLTRSNCCACGSL